jgi:hypothetical protein
MMTRVKTTLLLAALAGGLTAARFGADPAPSAAEAIASAARHLEARDGDGREADDRGGAGDERGGALQVFRFETVLKQLRAVPALAPLFERYGVPDPLVDDARGHGLVSLLQAVRIRARARTVTITNRETGGVIYAAPLSDVASGTYEPEHLPGATPPSPSTYMAYASSRSGHAPRGR